MPTDKINITKIEVVEFNCELGRPSMGDGSGYWRILGGIKIHTNAGITGEYVGRHPSEYAGLRHYASSLMGLNPLEREKIYTCLLYTSPSPRDLSTSRMPSSA